MGTIIHEFVTTMKSVEELNKEQEYMNYLEKHISNVNKAYRMYFVPLLCNKDIVFETVSKEDLFEAIKLAKVNIEKHDASKYDDIEFYGYRKHFYPTAEEKAFGEEYEKQINAFYEESWKHHYENNPHHQEYWIDKESNTPKDMDLRYIIEMLCDWLSMGMYFGTSTLEWYENSAQEEKMNMSENTRLITEELLHKVIYK